MPKVQSSVTELPLNCKSAAEHTAQVLREEDQYADLPEHCQQSVTDLERMISKETGENVALVAYRL